MKQTIAIWTAFVLLAYLVGTYIEREDRAACVAMAEKNLKAFAKYRPHEEQPEHTAFIAASCDTDR